MSTTATTAGFRRCALTAAGVRRTSAAIAALRVDGHQNCVPTLKVMSCGSSPGWVTSALAISMRNGPNGEFQFTPKPTDTRGFGVSPRNVSRNAGRRLAEFRPCVPVGQPAGGRTMSVWLGPPRLARRTGALPCA